MAKIHNPSLILRYAKALDVLAKKTGMQGMIGGQVVDVQKTGEKLNEDEQEELEFLKRKLSREEFSYPTYYPNEVDISDKKDNEFADVLVHSGILLLEDIIFN